MARLANKEEKKQGQQGFKPKKLCPVCNSYLYTMYYKEGNKLKRLGQYCINEECNIMVREDKGGA